MKIQRIFTCTCGRKVTISISLLPSVVRHAKRTCRHCRSVWQVNEAFQVSRIGTRPLVRKTWMGATDSDTQGKACHETVEQLNNPGNPWLSICCTHKRVVGHDSWELARYNAEHTSEWCECCYPQGCGDTSCESCGTSAQSRVAQSG